jgi:hypothetical protein
MHYPSGNKRRILRVPARLVLEPPEILRMRAALERGDSQNPDANIPPMHEPLSPDVIARFRTLPERRNRPYNPIPPFGRPIVAFLTRRSG